MWRTGTKSSHVKNWYRLVLNRPCADPGIFVRGGGPGQTDKIKLWQRFFLILSLFYRSQWSISKKSIIFHGSRGDPTFSRGVQVFPGGGGGSNCLFPIETHLTCDFPGGSGPPVYPSGSALDRPRYQLQNCDKSVRVFETWSVHYYLYRSLWL